jgi:hypothetical protein
MTRRTRSATSTMPPLTPAQVHTIGLALNRWFRNQRGSDRVWQSLVHACGTAAPQHVKGCTPEARLVRHWLKYRELARREGSVSAPAVIDQFNLAYTLWLTCQRRRP